MKSQKLAIFTSILMILLILMNAIEETTANTENDSTIKIHKPTITRTQLRVSKSLNPDDMQEINVRSNNGGYAKILVKKRDGKSSNIPRVAAVYNIDNTLTGNNDENIQNLFSRSVHQLQPQHPPQYQQQQQQQQQPIWTPVNDASPSITASYRFASDINTDNDSNSMQIIKSFMKHIQQIESNPRTFNTIEVESSIKNDRRPVHIALADTKVNDSDEIQKIPAPVFISSEPMYIKDADNNNNNNNNNNKNINENVIKNNIKKGRSIDSSSVNNYFENGIPVINGIRVPDDEEDKVNVWRNARVINGELVPYKKGYVPKKTEYDIGQLVFVNDDNIDTNDDEKQAKTNNIGPFMTSDNFPSTDKPKNLGPFTVEDNLKTNNDDQLKNKDFQRFVNTDKRGFGPFSIDDNSKVANSKLIEYIKRINEQENRRDYFAGRSTKLFPNNNNNNNNNNYNNYYPQSYGITSRSSNDAYHYIEADAAAPQIQRRMLQNPGNPSYPTSSLYSTTKTSATINNEQDGTRRPVLEYAHPELGVQAARLQPIDDGQPAITRQQHKIQYYVNDVQKNDQSRFLNDGETLSANKQDYYPEPNRYNKEFYENYSSQQQKQQQQQQQQRPATYPYNYGYLRKVKEQPFYWKFAEQMRNSFQNGFATVQGLTRPVLEPLVEAGHKISTNLGFTKQMVSNIDRDGKSNNDAQDKIGLITTTSVGGAAAAAAAAPTTSVLFPALGLMAGGAALGLGAMAVGRYFDGNLLKRSSGINLDDSMLINLEHKRALDAIENGENIYVVMAQDNGDNNREKNNNKNENINNNNNNNNNDVMVRRLRRSIDNNFNIIDDNLNENMIRVKRQHSNVVNTNEFSNYEIVDIIENPIIDFNQYSRGSGSGRNIKKRSIKNELNNNDPDNDDEQIGTILQNVEKDLPTQITIGFEEQIRNTNWSNTPCAKKVFCEVMLQQNSDEIVLMEKKMDTLLYMMHPTLRHILSDHLSEVTDAIRKRDCSLFICNQR